MRLTALFMMAFIATTAQAERYYDIELLIYKHSKLGEQFRSEHWPNTWLIPNISESLDLNRIPTKQQEKFRRLQDDETTFEEIVEKVTEAERYEILSYQAWRQPGLDKDNRIAIQINAGQIYTQVTELPVAVSPGIKPEPETEEPETGSLFIPQSQLDEFLEPMVSRDPSLPLTLEYRTPAEGETIDRDQRVYELQGTVEIVLSRFLHVYSDLLLLQPVYIEKARSNLIDEDTALISDDNEDILLDNEKPKFNVELVSGDEAFTTLHGFNIKQHRRMRSGELHYIDHPLLGIVIQARPVKKEKKDES